MIEAYDTATFKQSINAQELLGILVDRYGDIFTDIVYDTTTPTDIKELWVSDEICITYVSGTSIKFLHSNGYEATMSGSSTTFTRFYITKFDNCLLVMNSNTFATSTLFFIIAKTIDSNGNNSQGIITRPGTSSNVKLFTDNMNIDSVGYDKLTNNSVYSTVLAPLYAITGDESFTDIYYSVLSKATDYGQVILNGKKFYMITNNIAIAYT